MIIGKRERETHRQRIWETNGVPSGRWSGVCWVVWRILNQLESSAVTTRLIPLTDVDAMPADDCRGVS